MTHTRLCKRIKNLDAYWLSANKFRSEAMKHPADSEERRWLGVIADRFSEQYDRMVADRRRTDA